MQDDSPTGTMHENGDPAQQVEPSNAGSREDFSSNRLFQQVWKAKAQVLKLEVRALYLAYRDPRVPWRARIFAGLVVAYAFSPIDLIPDPIPILGYLDDLIIVPFGAWLALKMIPPEVMKDCRERAAREAEMGQPVNWLAAGVIVVIWIGLAALVIVAGFRLWRR